MREALLHALAGGLDGLHGLDDAGKEVVELHAVELGALADDVAVAAGGKALVLELLLERLELKVHDGLGRAHEHSGLDEAGQLVAGKQDALHLATGSRKVRVVVGVVRLDGAGQLLGAAGLLDELGRLHGVLDLVLELLPVKVVEKADLAPELHVCRVVLLRIVA